MSYRNERMMRGFRSLDALLNGRDPSKFPPLSDLESGARQIRRGTEEDDACTDLPGEESPEAALDAAAWDEACADPTSDASPEAALDAAVWDEACAYPPAYQEFLITRAERAAKRAQRGVRARPTRRCGRKSSRRLRNASSQMGSKGSFLCWTR